MNSVTSDTDMSDFTISYSEVSVGGLNLFKVLVV